MSLRSTVRSTAGWAFGLSLSVLFIALWGRAVVVDTDTLAESLSPLARSDMVSELLTDWMTAEMIESGADPSLVAPTVDHVIGSSALAAALDQLTVEVVEAAASTDPQGSTVDMRSLVLPAVPEVSAGLGSLGLAVTERQVGDIVEDFDPLVIREPASATLIGYGSTTAARLGTATLIAAVAMAIFGYAVMATSEDRLTGLRSLLSRVAIGGLGFAIILRLGSWILDPRGGRAPLQETISAVAVSKWMLPLQVGVVAAVVAGLIVIGRRLFRPSGGFQSRDERPTHPEEQQLSLSGPR